MAKCRKKTTDQSIIVYIIDYKRVGHNQYDEVVFDFRTDQDYDNFFNEMQLQRSMGNQGQYSIDTLISLKNYHSPKKLTRDCYYKFDIDAFKSLSLSAQKINDVSLFGYCYNFDGVPKTKDTHTSLFVVHGPLDNEEVFEEPINYEGVTLKQLQTPLKIMVYNVGQGNCNEVLEGDTVSMVFDAGYDLYGKGDEVQQFIDKRIKAYKENKPYLIISHWDLDHVKLLSQMSDTELGYFSDIFCPRYTKSKASRDLVKKLKNAKPGNSVHILPDSPIKGPEYPSMEEYKRGNQYAMYQGEFRGNINYSGIVLFIHGLEGNALLTGDCALVQASDVVKSEIAKISKGKNLKNLDITHNLVVPHHGGDYKYMPKIYKTYNLNKSVIRQKAAISVGDNNNYKHPSKSILNMLNFMSVEQTNIVGDISIIL